MKRTKGFTLIELLVVVAIIGLLSSVVMASLNSSRVKARDAKRMLAIAEIKKAMELYYDANNSVYPHPGAGLQSPNDIRQLWGIGGGANVLGQYLASPPQLPTDVWPYLVGSSVDNNEQGYAFLVGFEGKTFVGLQGQTTACYTGMNLSRVTIPSAWSQAYPQCPF